MIPRGVGMQRHFDKDIQALMETLLRMGALVEEQISLAVQALQERDSDLAERVIEADDAIDLMELEVDREVLELIAKMQPAARDLRFAAGVMKIAPELERIADLAQDVAERVLELNREPALAPTIEVPRLASIAQDMVRGALDALVRRDPVLARNIIARDDEIDALTEQSFRELLTYMLEDPRTISRAIRLTFLGKYFERMADGATNICEMVVYMVEGKVIKHAS